MGLVRLVVEDEVCAGDKVGESLKLVVGDMVGDLLGLVVIGSSCRR